LELLRKKDLHSRIGAAKSTVADWIEDFNVYIPKVKQGNVAYYKPETVDVLLFIKQCREQNYQKPQIMEMLAEKGFPITVEEAVEDIRKSIEGDSPRDNLITIMQTMGQAVTKIAEQDERLDGQGKAIKAVKEHQNETDERIKEVEKRYITEVEHLKNEMESLKKELAASKEKKGFFQRLFGK
jgi:DNA-binding transcriptional MerR regulator